MDIEEIDQFIEACDDKMAETNALLNAIERMIKHNR